MTVRLVISDVDGTLVEAVLQEVDPRICRDDVLGKIHVRAFERGSRLRDCFVNQLGDLDEVVTYLGELLLKNLAH